MRMKVEAQVPLWTMKMKTTNPIVSATSQALVMYAGYSYAETLFSE
jgi:hypothetical protein